MNCLFFVPQVVCIANIKAMNIQNISGEIFCVGTNKKTSINELIDILNKKYSKNLNANYFEKRRGDIKESVCDNSKIKEIFNMQDMTSFEIGVLNI